MLCKAKRPSKAPSGKELRHVASALVDCTADIHVKQVLLPATWSGPEGHQLRYLFGINLDRPKSRQIAPGATIVDK